MSDIIANDEPEVPVDIHYLYENTPLIRIADMSYPRYLRDFRNENRNVTMTVDYIDAEIVALYNYFEVWLVPAPTEGDVITEGAPEKRDDGKWYQTWNVRAYTEEEIASNLADAKERALEGANTIIAQDLTNGITVQYDGVAHRVPSTAGDRVDWGNALFALMNKANTDTFSVRVAGSSIAMSVADATTFYHTAIETHFALIDTFYNYIDEVTATTAIGAIPVVPETFFGAPAIVAKTTETTTTSSGNGTKSI